ncbi:MAG: hypothetical protein IPN92_13390 [Chromatiaceae bacterium]|nr:hypothetical protein [Chromatiaceae bacterium]
MIYHRWSVVGLIPWAGYAPLGLKPWLSLRDIYARYLCVGMPPACQW